MPSVSEFDPLAPDTVECPFPFYQAMRDEAPVYRVPEMDFFIVSKYDDALRVLKDTGTFSSRSGPGLRREPDEEITAIMREGWMPVDTLLTNDPPIHSRYRNLVNKAFSPRRVEQLDPSIRLIANDLVDRFIGAGRVELVKQYATPLPMTVIADALGVSRDDMDTFKRWSDDAVEPLGGFLTRERSLECARSSVQFQHYFAARLDERRSSPRDDILTDLINARLDGENPLDMAEMLGILAQLLVAGNETTTNLIGSGAMLLAQNPGQFELLRNDPSLIPNFVEETLRLEAPVQGLFRVANRDVEVGGVAIPAGSRVVVMYASANRDEDQYEEAPGFDVCRGNARTHLSFGHGVHFCLGASLARLDATIGFQTLLGRLNNIRLAEGKNDFKHTPSFILRGLKQLHMEFDPA
jgi:cytochrome P450